MSPRTAGSRSADEPLDDSDFGLLDDIREMFQAADPMPADLPERIRFSLALRDLEIEVARLAAEEDRPVAGRPRGGAEPDDHLRQRQPDHHDPDRREPGRDGAGRRLAGAAAAPGDRDEDRGGRR